MNRITIYKKIIQSIQKYITDSTILETHRAKDHFVRKRKLSMSQIILYLLYTSKASMFQNLSRIREDLAPIDFPNVSKQAVSKARQFISPDLFKDLFYLSVDLFYKLIPKRKRWHGYHLFAIDGSSLKESYRISKKCSGDMIDILPGNKKKGTKDIKIRVIKVILDNDSKEYFATNLFDPSITKKMFQELYFYRWPVETKYKELKDRLAIEEFSGASTVSVFQEFYINLLFSNISSLIKNQADEEIQISAKSTNKHRYQSNRSFIIGRIKSIIPKILCCILDLSAIDQLFTEAVRCRSQLLPGRSFHRKRTNRKDHSHFKSEGSFLII